MLNNINFGFEPNAEFAFNAVDYKPRQSYNIACLCIAGINNYQWL